MAHLLIYIIITNMTSEKLTEACTGFSVSEICWFARAREGSDNIVTVGIDVTTM